MSSLPSKCGLLESGTAVERIQRRGTRSRANTKERLQHFAAGAARTDSYEKAGSGIVVHGAAVILENIAV